MIDPNKCPTCGDGMILGNGVVAMPRECCAIYFYGQGSPTHQDWVMLNSGPPVAEQVVEETVSIARENDKREKALDAILDVLAASARPLPIAEEIAKAMSDDKHKKREKLIDAMVDVLAPIYCDTCIGTPWSECVFAGLERGHAAGERLPVYENAHEQTPTEDEVRALAAKLADAVVASLESKP